MSSPPTCWAGTTPSGSAGSAATATRRCTTRRSTRAGPRTPGIGSSRAMTCCAASCRRMVTSRSSPRSRATGSPSMTCAADRRRNASGRSGQRAPSSIIAWPTRPHGRCSSCGSPAPMTRTSCTSRSTPSSRTGAARRCSCTSWRRWSPIRRPSCRLRRSPSATTCWPSASSATVRATNGTATTGSGGWTICRPPPTWATWIGTAARRGSPATTGDFPVPSGGCCARRPDATASPPLRQCCRPTPWSCRGGAGTRASPSTSPCSTVWISTRTSVWSSGTSPR